MVVGGAVRGGCGEQLGDPAGSRGLGKQGRPPAGLWDWTNKGAYWRVSGPALGEVAF